MRKITSVNVLVHPDFDAREHFTDSSELSPTQLDLRSRWEERVRQIAEQDDAILIYLTALSPEVSRRVLDDEDLIPNSLIKDEVQRIKRWGNILGNRFVLFHEDDEITHGKFNELTRGEFIVDQEAQLVSFGEYGDLCASGFVQKYKKALGITTRPSVDMALSLLHKDRIGAQTETVGRRRIEA